MVTRPAEVSETSWNTFSDDFKEIVAEAKAIHDSEKERELPTIPLHLIQWFGIRFTVCDVPITDRMEFWDGKPQRIQFFPPGRKSCRECGTRNY